MSPLAERLMQAWMTAQANKASANPDPTPLWEIVNMVPEVIAELNGERDRDAYLESGCATEADFYD